jgi:hypothetical protein
VAQAEKFDAPAEPRVQRRMGAADLAVATQGAAVEPQVGLSIELVLQVVSQGFIGGVMARAIEGTVADSPHGLVFDDDREPLARLGANLAPAGDEHRYTFYVVNRLKEAQTAPVARGGQRGPDDCSTLAWRGTCCSRFAGYRVQWIRPKLEGSDMADNMSVTGPVMINHDGAHRVAWDIAKHIDTFSTIEAAQKDERYWLTLFEHALAVANKGQVRIVLGDRR